jgi:hypothetical protein
MSDEHKEALAIGREQSRAVRNYLEALDRHRPRRGRKRTAESVQRQLDAVEERLYDADPLSRLNLLQERIDLQDELLSMNDGFDVAELQDAFVLAAREYGERKGITYMVWREVGVDAAVLKLAGISRSGA